MKIRGISTIIFLKIARKVLVLASEKAINDCWQDNCKPNKKIDAKNTLIAQDVFAIKSTFELNIFANKLGKIIKSAQRRLVKPTHAMV